MTSLQIIIVIVVIIVVAGIFVFPFLNRKSLSHMPIDQQILVLLRQADSLDYIKNISSGSSGSLVYIKNKRKILVLPWILSGSTMLCTKQNPLSNWDYPEEKEPLDSDEKERVISRLEKYNKSRRIKFVIPDE